MSLAISDGRTFPAVFLKNCNPVISFPPKLKVLDYLYFSMYQYICQVLNMKFLTYKNYLTVIKNSADSKMFRHVYVLDNNKEKDILKGGQLSCAYYVSCILKLFNLIDQEISPHAVVGGLIKNMSNNGWKETKELKPGNILLWEEKSGHQHLGFYLGKDKAISHRDKKKVPTIHHYTYKNKRKIVKIFTHKIIE